MSRVLVPVAFVVLFGAVVGLLFLLRGDPEPREGEVVTDDAGKVALPDVIAPEHRDLVRAVRARIREKLGKDPQAFGDLWHSFPKEPEDRVPWLRFFRAEFDLAIRSGDAEAGAAALGFLGEALGDG